MKAYIQSSALVSALPTFGILNFPLEEGTLSQTGFLRCVEPNFRDYLEPLVARRMSRIVKIAVSAALQCLRYASVERPDGILVGTGLGCLEDTEKFLASLYENQEKLLNPTPFIQSTHNTVTAAIAQSIHCHSYNTTYTQRGVSFECAMTDALLMLEDEPESKLLVGGYDERTEQSFQVTQRLGMWRRKSHSSGSPFLKPSTAGEGAGFFLLSGKPGADNLGMLTSLRTFSCYDGALNMKENLEQTLREAGLVPSDIDVALLGTDGAVETDFYYENLLDCLDAGTTVACFKHLSGDFDTAPVFALWLACVVAKNQEVPARLIWRKGISRGTRNILIYNNWHGLHHSWFVVTSC